MDPGFFVGMAMARVILPCRLWWSGSVARGQEKGVGTVTVSLFVGLSMLAIIFGLVGWQVRREHLSWERTRADVANLPEFHDGGRDLIG